MLFILGISSIRLLFALILMQKAINRRGSRPFLPWPNITAHDSGTHARWNSNLDTGQDTDQGWATEHGMVLESMGWPWWAWDGPGEHGMALEGMGWPWWPWDGPGEHTACGMTSLAFLQERSSHCAIPLTQISPGQLLELVNSQTGFSWIYTFI